MSQDFLASDMPSKRRQILFIILVTLAICVIALWADVKVTATILPSDVLDDWGLYKKIGSTILENLIAGSIAAVLLALIYRSAIQWIDPRDFVIEIPSNDITKRLCSNAMKTHKYVFIGNTATFVSSTILPILVDKARDNTHPRSVVMILLDPLNLEAISSYAAFKSRISQARAKLCDGITARWTPPLYNPKVETEDDVIAKLIAAIYLAAYASLQQGMEVSVFLRKSFTPFRADMTDSEIVLTQESPDDSAVAFLKTGEFYGWYHKEADSLQSQSIRIDFDGEQENLQKFNLAHPSFSVDEIEASINSVLSHFLHLQPLLNKTEAIQAAINRIRKPSHAYG